MHLNKKIIPSFLLNKPVSIDWKLLLFLLLFLNVKLLIKVAAVFIMYVMRPDFKFGFKFTGSRLPLFYAVIMGIGFLNWLLSGLVGNFNYDLVFITGILFWVLCILAIHQIKLAIELNDPAIIHRTILVFFILNALVSLAVYTGIVWEIGTINPYRYQGNFQKYFISTGDYIKGISYDTSTTNAVLNAFAVIYFLTIGKNVPTLLCMAVLLLTGSNITSILLCLVLIFIFICRSSKDQKSMIIVCLLMLIVFFVKISPQNNNYVIATYQRIFNQKVKISKTAISTIPITQKPDSILTPDERKDKIALLYMDSINLSLYNKNQGKMETAHGEKLKYDLKEKPTIPADSIHTPTFQHKDYVSEVEKNMLQFSKKNYNIISSETKKINRPKLPGKLSAIQQTWQYFYKHPYKILTGTGIANFSSKLAFRATTLKIAGNYPQQYAYINDDFKFNHLKIYMYYFTGNEEIHSIANSPNNTYDQLMSEYGLAGLFAFPFLYIGFFIKQTKKLTYGIPIILLMLGVFFFDYWFEQLSVVVLFELLLLSNMKELNP